MGQNSRWLAAQAVFALLGLTSCGTADKSDGSETTTSSGQPSGPSGQDGGGTYSAAHPENSDSSTAAGWLTDEASFNDHLRKLADEDSDCVRVQTLSDAYASLVAFPASRPLFLTALHDTAAEVPKQVSGALMVIEDWLRSSDPAAATEAVVAANATVKAYLEEQCG